MRILITGGAGFLGRRVVAECMRRGHRLRCMIRRHEQGREITRHLERAVGDRLELFAGKLGDPDFCRELTQDCDVVIHVASPLTGSTSALFAAGVVPTRVLVDAAVRAGVQRFVLVSSIGVYGTPHLVAGAVLDERCPVDVQPHLRDPYTFSKVVQEQVCWDAHRDHALPLVVVRPGVLFGPGRPLLSARVGLRLGGLLIQMDGRQLVPYCYVDDCALAVTMAAEVAGIEGLSFNIVGDDLPSGSRVLNAHRKRISPITVIRIPRLAIAPVARICEGYSAWTERMLPAVLTPYKAAALWKRLRYSNGLAKQRLGWRPSVSFQDGVERTVQELRERP